VIGVVIKGEEGVGDGDRIEELGISVYRGAAVTGGA